VVFPALAYPTYDVGARLAGASSVPADGLLTLGPATPALVWINTPGNPTGQVLPAEHLRKVVSWARERGVLLVSDECYIELGWTTEPVSILHPDVCGGSHEGLLALHSLSKRSNMAGYRAGFVAGDPSVVKRLLEVRKHAGMIMPDPVQAAMVAALGDDAHVAEQRERYSRRRTALKAAFEAHGFRIDHSEASLYLWATRDEPAGTPPRTWPHSASSSHQATSTAPRAPTTSASPSPPPTNASPPPSPASPLNRPPPAPTPPPHR